MFKFPIFYYPDGDQGGGQEENEEYGEERESQEQSQDQQDSQDDSGGDTTTQGTAVNYNTDTEIQSDTPDVRGKEIQGEGEKYLKVKEYVGTKSQHTRNMIFGAPPPSGLPKHIQLVAGVHAPGGSLIGPKLRVTVNQVVTAEDPSTGSLNVDSAFDSVQSLQDITPNNAGAPYFTNTGQGPDIIDMYGLGTQSFLSYQTGQEEYITSNTTTNQLYIEYENDYTGGGSCTTLPYCPFQRRILVTWASGEDRTFEVILPGWGHANLSNGSPSHTTFVNSVRADGCAGDGNSHGLTGQVHTSRSENRIYYNGNQHADYAYLGFFKTVNGNNVGLPNNFEYSSSWGPNNYYDFGYDSNGGPFGFGVLGNQEEDFSGEQYYKAIIANIDSTQNVSPAGFQTADTYFDNNIPPFTTAYDYAAGELLNQSQLIGFGIHPGFDSANTAAGFRFMDVHVYSENTPDCTSAPSPITFTVCDDVNASDYYLLTGVDCSSNDLTAFGTPPVNYLTGGGATFISQTHPNNCCTDCNGLQLSVTKVDPTIQGGDDGIIEVTVLDGGFSGATAIPGQPYTNGGIGTATGNETGNGRYAWTIRANSLTKIGGLGSTGTANVVGYGYATHPLGGQDYVNTFTLGFQEDLAQDAVTTPQNSTFAGLTQLSVTMGSTTTNVIPASTVNGTVSTGLIAGCYQIYVRDESQNGAGSTVPCFKTMEVCLDDGVGIAGCTDNDASTNFGAALNYQSNAVVDDGSCLYCNATTGALINSSGNLANGNGDIAVGQTNSITATPTVRTNSADGIINIGNLPATTQFQPFINDVVDANGMFNADYTIQFYNTTSKVHWDAAQTSSTPNDLTNFSTVGSLINNGQGQWQGSFTTTSVGANLNYGYYAVKIAISDPDAAVEVEDCFQVFYFVIPINVCVDPSGQFATAITNTSSPPGTLIIQQSEDILWYSNPTMCTILNNYCCNPPSLTNPSGPCQVNELVADFYCDPVPSLLTFELQYQSPTSNTFTTISTNTYTPTNSATYSYTYTQGSSITANTFTDDGFYRVVLTSSYPNSADCTTTSPVVQITSAIFGCMDSTALNYDPTATCPDTCVYCVYGCTDDTMSNYNPLATCDDGSCVPFVYGCTDPLALNYYAGANIDDGSCTYGVLGCTDPTAYNYNKNCAGQIVTATVDDGCCFYPCSPANQGPPSLFSTNDATGGCPASNNDGQFSVSPLIMNTGAMAGQSKTVQFFDNSGNLLYTDPTTYNSANSPLPPGQQFNQFTSTLTNIGPGVYLAVITDNFGCVENVYGTIGSATANCGCMDPNASNYDPTATIDDGSCLYPGCIDPNALNYDPNASIDDGSCLYPTVVNPCIPGNTNSLISLLEACIAKNGFTYYNKLVTGQADDCSIMNAWKVILIEYLVSKRGTKCIYNCADSATPNASTIGTCASLWTTGGPVTGLNDQGHAGSSIATGEGTTITDPNLYFVASNTLYLGDVIKMPSGLIYQVVPPTTSISAAGHNPESARGAKSGVWQQCVSGLQVTSFPDSVNYLDKFNTFVAKFCVDCNIVDENVIRNVKSIPPSRRGRSGRLSIDGINGLEI